MEPEGDNGTLGDRCDEDGGKCRHFEPRGIKD